MVSGENNSLKEFRFHRLDGRKYVLLKVEQRRFELNKEGICVSFLQ